MYNLNILILFLQPFILYNNSTRSMNTARTLMRRRWRSSYSDNSTSRYRNIYAFRIQPLSLSHLRCNGAVFVGEICIVQKQFWRRF